MRLSCIQTSPHYAPQLLGRSVVYLNGVRAGNVVEFDDQNDWIIMVALSDRGTTTPHKLSPVGVRCVKYRGRVQATLLPVGAPDTMPVIHDSWISPSSD